ncbi:signal peptidase subunit-domain-containing protein [Jimgerdemannia flammicorona]|uniref:Signal peptidase subunit 3 n=1 Tax=Jimgerdemannia flammicorona TaxID=994334 RepID=A0A433QB27_9FUNG|nr:signal peptidase subunit-domain-containing protein [Jimgerdemannia flammicorona]
MQTPFPSDSHPLCTRTTMHNLQQRANAVSAFAISVLFSLLAAVALLSYVMPPPEPTADVAVTELRVRREYLVLTLFSPPVRAGLYSVTGRYGPDYFDYGKKTNEFAFLAFDLDADLTPLFDWNTKQVFVCLVAEYESKTHNHNQVVVWDTIIEDKENAVLEFQGERNTYALIDVSTKWQGLVANFSLRYDVTPHVGVLRSGLAGSSKAMPFPVAEKR